MAYKVLLTKDAARDLEDIYAYIARADTPDRAEYVLEKIVDTFSGLAELPMRGVIPQELRALGSVEFREVFFKPYRIFYRVEKKRVQVVFITDGRRDLSLLLRQRLLLF